MAPLFPIRPRASEGVQLRTAIDMIKWVLRRRSCEFKVGVATALGYRWQMYRGSDSTWKPSHMFILLRVTGRVAAGWAETVLIHACETVHVPPACCNMNAMRNDLGGAGSASSPDAVRYVYLAVSPVADD